MNKSRVGRTLAKGIRHRSLMRYYAVRCRTVVHYPLCRVLNEVSSVGRSTMGSRVFLSMLYRCSSALIVRSGNNASLDLISPANRERRAAESRWDRGHYD